MNSEQQLKTTNSDGPKKKNYLLNQIFSKYDQYYEKKLPSLGKRNFQTRVTRAGPKVVQMSRKQRALKRSKLQEEKYDNFVANRAQMVTNETSIIQDVPEKIDEVPVKIDEVPEDEVPVKVDVVPEKEHNVPQEAQQNKVPEEPSKIDLEFPDVPQIEQVPLLAIFEDAVPMSPDSIKPYPVVEDFDINPEEHQLEVSISHLAPHFKCCENSKILSQDFWKLSELIENTEILNKNFTIYQKLRGDSPDELYRHLDHFFSDFFNIIFVPKLDGLFILTQEKIKKLRLVQMFYFGSGTIQKEANQVQKYFRARKIECENLINQTLPNLLIPLSLPTDAISKYEKMVVIGEAIQKLGSIEKIQILASKKKGQKFLEFCEKPKLREIVEKFERCKNC